MDRRTVLSGIGLGLIGLAGCSGGDGGGKTTGGPGDTPRDDRTTAEPTTTQSTTATTATSTTATPDPRAGFRDIELPVPADQLRRGAGKNQIPAITEPAFDSDWSGIEVRGQPLTLADDDEVIGVSRGGTARAYPLRILDYHEIVNDTLDGPLLVTFCPLCGSGMTAERRVDGEETIFGVSGLLFRNDLVMFDKATESLWSQIMATAIRGPRTGDRLTLVPSTLTTWGEWRGSHPDTQVLLPPPKSGTIVDALARPYDREAYPGYSESRRIGIGGTNPDDRLHPKTMVIGVSDDGVDRAYPLPAVQEAGVVNDTVGSLPVVVAATEAGTMVAYVRRLDGETVTFQRDGQFLVADGSRFRLTDGVAVDGPHEGDRLQQANEISQEFWFAWANFHPETEIWGRDDG